MDILNSTGLFSGTHHLVNKIATRILALSCFVEEDILGEEIQTCD